MPTFNSFVIKSRYFPITFSVIVLIIVCTCDTNEISQDNVYTIDIDPRLELVAHDLYKLELDTTSYQTIHRITGTILMNNQEPYPPLKVYWQSNLNWFISDTTYVIVKNYLNNFGEWVAIDTSYVIGFGGELVPTINSVSYSGTGGEINTVIAPVLDMRLDTLVVRVQFMEIEKIVNILLK